MSQEINCETNFLGGPNHNTSRKVFVAYLDGSPVLNCEFASASDGFVVTGFDANNDMGIGAKRKIYGNVEIKECNLERAQEFFRHQNNHCPICRKVAEGNHPNKTLSLMTDEDVKEYQRHFFI